MPGLIYQFGDYWLDCGAFQLLREGLSLHVERKPLELLILLTSRHGQLVARSEIATRLWSSEVFVDTEHGINTAVRKLRSVLRDDPEHPQFIKTVVGMGYLFIAPVTTTAEPPPEAIPRETAAAEPIPALPRRLFGYPAWMVLASLGALLIAIAIAARPLFQRNASPVIHSLAVLPLENFSGDPSQDYFADGMTDELTTMLAKDSNLHVTSRTSVMQFKGTHASLPAIAGRLHVDAILEGSVARSHNRVHMTLQLIRADADTHLWAESYDRDAAEVALLPDQAARAIANRLNRATPSPAVVRSVRPEAHDAYLHGLYFWYAGQMEPAGKYFRLATSLQPDYALGWSGLSGYYSLSADLTMDPREVLPKAEASAARALTLDPLLADAHLSMSASLLFGGWDLPHADGEALRAIQLDPEFAQAYHMHAMILAAMNRQTEALAAQRKATELNPYIRPWAQPRALLWAGQYDAALQDALPRLAATPNIAYLNLMVARIYHAKKMDNEAARLLLKSLLLDAGSKPTAGMQRAYQQGGYRGLVSWQLGQLQAGSRGQWTSRFAQATLYAALENREKTLALLEESVHAHSPGLVWVQCDPEFDFLHADPRFEKLVRQIGLLPAW